MSLPCKCIHHHFTNFNENTHTFKKKYNKNRYKRKKASHSGILLIFGCVLKLEEVRFKTKIRTFSFWWTKVVVVQMYLLVVVVFVKERCALIESFAFVQYILKGKIVIYVVVFICIDDYSDVASFSISVYGFSAFCIFTSLTFAWM